MKTYLQTSTSDPPLQGKGALAKHTLVCHHQGMFGCRENERKKREEREVGEERKRKTGELTMLCISTKPKVRKLQFSQTLELI